MGTVPLTARFWQPIFCERAPPYTVYICILYSVHTTHTNQHVSKAHSGFKDSLFLCIFVEWSDSCIRNNPSCIFPRVAFLLHWNDFTTDCIAITISFPVWFKWNDHSSGNWLLELVAGFCYFTHYCCKCQRRIFTNQMNIWTRIGNTHYTVLPVQCTR